MIVFRVCLSLCIINMPSLHESYLHCVLENKFNANVCSHVLLLCKSTHNAHILFPSHTKRLCWPRASNVSSRRGHQLLQCQRQVGNMINHNTISWKLIYLVLLIFKHWNINSCYCGNTQCHTVMSRSVTAQLTPKSVKRRQNEALKFDTVAISVRPA